MIDLQRAEKALAEGGYTLVLVKGERVITSNQRGVAPLLALIDTDVTGFSAADKVVGKAAALLYVKLGVCAVSAGVISSSAVDTLKKCNIECRARELTENIINRAGDGICPMEQAVAGISSPEKAVIVLKETIAKMKADKFGK